MGVASRPLPSYRPAPTAAALACGLANSALLLPPAVEWLGSWRGLLDLFASLWTVLFVAFLVLFWTGDAVRSLLQPTAPSSPSTPMARPRRSPGLTPRWALVLLVVCGVELLTHAGERNGFLASSRPTSGVETWTTADGYAVLLDGIPAQGDGLFLLPMLNLFLDDGPPAPSEFDRRAGHVYLVSLLARPLGTYWSFAAVNLLAWWGAALAVWWLGQRRWPGSAVPWIASLLVATGQGFLFMGAAPQAHVAAYAAFAFFLVLCDALRLWTRDISLRPWLSAGWAAGAAGLIYLVNLPCLLFLWLYSLAGLTPRRLIGLILSTLTAFALVSLWVLYGRALGLGFSGGNNDLAGQAIAGWLRVLHAGPYEIIGQLRAGSVRGISVAAFYYPLWVLAVLGLVVSGRDARRWALAVLVAGILPAIAFSTRFHLPRLAYFMYPAVYLLAAAGMQALARPLPRPAAVTLLATLTLGLIALSNLDLLGIQQLNLWFHYSQGNTW